MNIKKQVYEDIVDQYPYGLLRKFMSTEEIKAANILVKEGKVYKSKMPEKHATIAYFKSYEASEYDENIKKACEY